MITRKAVAADAPAIAQIHAASWRDAYAEILDADFLAGPIEQERAGFWTDRLRQPVEGLEITLAVKGEAPVAFICVIADTDPIWGARVDNLHVLPAFRGGGVGEHLLRQAAADLAARRGATGLHLWVFEANTKGRRFYERLGARSVERSASLIPSAGGKPVLRLHWPDARSLAAPRREDRPGPGRNAWGPCRLSLGTVQGGETMKVRDVMTASVVTAGPGDTIRDVARRMSEVDTGVIPVVEGEVVVGLITDRDIVLRIVAEDGDIDAPVSQFMTTGVETCQADDSLRDAARKMADLQIRRLIVLENQKFAGILSLGDVAREVRGTAGSALEEISDPGDRPA